MPVTLPAVLRTSIEAKVTAIIGLAVLIAVTLTALTSAFREADRRFLSKKGELEGIAAAIAASVAQPLAHNNSTDAGRTLTAIRNIHDVTFAQVIDGQGRSLVQLGNAVVLERPEYRVIPNMELGLFSRLLLRNYMVETPIVNGGQTIGKLRIIANISSLRNALRESVTSALLAGALAACMGLLLSQKLQRSITQPIGKLTSAIHNVRSTRDYALSVERTSEDETGLMVDAFNDMLLQIRERDNSLARHRDRLEIEVEERTADLKEATLTAQSANAAKSEFLATMSHEIRTPLNGMLVMAELLSSADLPNRMQRHADVIVSSGQSLLAIINDILDLSKIEAGRMELELLPVDPVSVSEQVMSLFSARAAAKKIDLACYVSPGVPARVGADPVRLNQILANLVNNALKFTEEGSVFLRVEANGASTEPGEPASLTFSVTDTGIGIASDKLKAIFDPFAQADQSTTRKFGGTGIGLSISRKLVSAMGGELSVASEVGKGSTFSFTIEVETIEPAPTPAKTDSSLRPIVALSPGATRTSLAALVRDHGFKAVETDELDWTTLTDSDVVFSDAGKILDRVPKFRSGAHPFVVLVADVGDVNSGSMIEEGRAHELLLRPLCRADVTCALANAAREPGKPVRSANDRRSSDKPVLATFPGMHVLAADDNAVNREVLGEALGRLGVKLTLVEDGLAAVEAAKQQRFDLILMDCSMPGLDGYEATRAIRRHEESDKAPSVPIVALTAHVAGMHAHAWRDAGMKDTLSKPFTLKGLSECLSRWLAPAEQQNNVVASVVGQPHCEVTGQPEAPVLDDEVLSSIRQMQGPSGDLLARIIKLYAMHAPPALERLKAALQSGEPTEIASTAHALKSLCRNIGALRLGDLLHNIECEAQGGQFRVQETLANELAEQLQLALDALAALNATEPGKVRAAS